MPKLNNLQVPQQAAIFLNVDLNVCLSNVLNVLCVAASYQASLPPASPARIKSILADGVLSPDAWYLNNISAVVEAPKQDGVKVGRDAALDSELGRYSTIDLVLAEAFGNREAPRMIRPALRSAIAEYVIPQRSVDDYGEYLFRRLTSLSDIAMTEGFAVTPGSGYIRSLLHANMPQRTLDQSFTLPHVASTYCAKWAELFFTIDNFRLTQEMFIPNPVSRKIENETIRRAIDPITALQSFALKNLSVPAIFLKAAQTHAFRGSAQQRHRELCEQTFLAVTRIQNPELIDRAKKLIAAIEAAPAHPITTMFESFFKSGTVRTSIGTHTQIWVPGDDSYVVAVPPDQVKKQDELHGIVTVGGVQYRVPDWLNYIEYAGVVEGRERALLVYANPFARTYANFLASIARSDQNANFSSGWGIQRGDVASYAEEEVSLISALRELDGSSELREEMAKNTAALRWAPISAQCGEVDMLGADFGWTDGRHCSIQPDQALMGISVLLPISNIRSFGIEETYEQDFLVEGSPEVYTLPIKGKVAANPDGYKYETKYLVPGMWMGEPDAERLFFGIATGDPITGAILARFRDLASYYFDGREIVLSKTEVAADSGFVVPDGATQMEAVVAAARWPVKGSDWDPYGYVVPGTIRGVTKASLATAWTTLAKAHGDEAIGVAWLYHATGGDFYQRAIARRARGDRAIAIGAEGRWLLPPFKFRGRYLFQTEIAGNYDLAALDKILAMAAPEKGSAIALMNEGEAGIK